MDWLDRLSLWAIVILFIGSSALISHHIGEAKPEKNNHLRINAPGGATPDDSENKFKEIRNLIEGNNLNKADAIIEELIQKYPYEGEPRMLKGDIFMRRQEPVKAVLQYIEAVDLNPDYLDKKTALFQGKKLKMAVNEALEETEGKLKTDSEDRILKKYRKNIYYLQRRIAGSCK